MDFGQEVEPELYRGHLAIVLDVLRFAEAWNRRTGPCELRL
jgi:hypothetical protein